MNYTDFYINTKRRTTEALLSMWAAGKKDTQEYLKQIFEEEPLLTEPVFQSMFPWQSDNRKFEEFKNIFDDRFINVLSGIEDKKFKFPKDRKPYTHQAESWKQLLNDEKSIVVTSGTGSGKTECFMLPIIQDLVRQKQSNYGNDKKGGIQAIFLYPLNALMSSQQKRMSAWCKSTNPQVSFAMYKGDTEENFKQIMKDALPELKSREQIRKTPPQILFTNPTMLEYMLVRKQDKAIIDISKQKKSLRWIVLDEAHTYSGSAAAELALQIRRILDAFGVTIDEVRFAASSATLGAGLDDEYKTFLSRVTGKKQAEIVVIHGNQIIPEIDMSTLNQIVSEINRDFDGKFKLSNEKILALRKELRNNALSAREITRRFSINQNNSIEDDLSLIDRLSEKINVLLSDIDRRGALLPTRSHFFVRNMGGLYACVNPKCYKHKDSRIDLGSLTTYAQTECANNDCHSKLIEVNRCSSCGNLLLVGQEQNNYYSFTKRETQSLFEIENNDDSAKEEIENKLDDAILFVLAKGVNEKPISNSLLFNRVIDVNEGKIKSGDGDYVECRKSNGTIICPHCGERTDKLQSLFSGNLFSRLLAPTLLEQAAPETDDKSALWQGRKYISFTDNRQGTAKSTFQQNIEVERNWIRTSIYHYLTDERRKTIIPAVGLTDAEERELNAIKQFNPDSPRVIDLENKKNGNTIASNPQKTFTDFANAIIGNSELIKLYTHLPDSFKNGRDENAYLKQLMIDQFGRRPRKSGVNNPETMGLVKVVYPSIEKATMPDAIERIFNDLKWSVQDWKDFLKITLDYFFRENKYIEVPIDTKRFRTQAFINTDVYPSSSNQRKKFPSLSIKNDDTIKNPNRLIVLLLLAMQIKKEEEISQYHETFINQILSATWNFLKLNVLKPNTDEESGYKLDLLSDKVAFQIIDKAWICPVNQVPLDTIFRGYSPLITSRITSNLEKYKITEPPIEYPYFPYAYKFDNNNYKIDDNTIINWMSKNLIQVQNKGLWSNLHERILLNNPVYLSAEHTAQQNKDVLRKIEEDFEKHKLNVLSCSTTMEMGVDISGISEVVMNNVPPKPSNYLQRAGRAGRGSETKALALTFCAPGPIGSNLFNNPKWAMTHKTAVPMVLFDSNILVQRHINSFLLSSYIVIDGENNLTVSSSVNNFFFPESGQINHQKQFCQFLKNLILNGNIALCARYKVLVIDTCKQTIPFDVSATACLSVLEKIRIDLFDKKIMLEEKIKQLKAAKYDESSPATIAIASQLRQILSQNILGFFAEHNFIPSAGIPTGIVDFDKYNIADYKIEKIKKEEKNKEGFEYHFGYQQANPSMLLTQAISEYAPGNQIILNETCYFSRGIVLKSQWDNARRVIFQYCPRCGYALTKEGDTLSKCPHCENENLKGIKSSSSNFASLIEPTGFRVDFSEEPTRTINSHYSKNYTQPELLNMPPWDEQDELSNVKLDLRNSGQRNAEILYYNLGNGYGYAVCLECGRAVPDIKEDNLTEALIKLNLFDHTPIIGGKKAKQDKEKCSNNHIKRNVLLGGRFQTDFVEIRFRNEGGKLIKDEETIFSLGVILTQKLTEKTGVNSQEISFGIKHYHNYSSIFIYDTAKGGAGYSTRFNELKEEVINLSKLTLENCKCEKSCDKCLINRQAQWSLDKLNRQKALEWLNLEICSRNQVPDGLKTKFSNNVYSITTNFSSEINRITVNSNLSKITFFIDNYIENWKPEIWEFYELALKLKKNGVSVSFAFQQPTTNLKKLSASQLSVIAAMRMSFSLLAYNPASNVIENLMIAEFSEAKQPIFYFSEANNISDKFDETWTKGNAIIYKVTLDSNIFSFTNWNPNFDFIKDDDKYIMFDFKITEKTTSRLLAKKITSFEKEKWSTIFDKISNSKINVSYTDIYLKSPLSCRILIDIIKWFVKETNLQIVDFNLYLAEVKNSREDDFYYTVQRDDYLATYANYFGLTPNLKKSGKLPHYRELKFECSEFDFIIRPDGGFENGWTLEWADNNSNWKDNYDADIRLHNLSVNIGGILYTIAYRQKKG